MAILLLLTFVASPLLLVLFVPIFGLCMGVRGPLVSSISTRYFAGPNVATIYGTIYASNALGAAFGSLMGGLLHDLTGGYRAGLAVAMICVVIASTPFWTLPGKVHLDRRVDRDEALEPGQHRGAVGVVRRVQAHLVVLARPVEERLRAHERTAVDLSAQRTLARELRHPVRNHARVVTQPAA